MGTEIPTESALGDRARMEPINIKTEPPPPIPDSDSFHQNGKLNSSHSAPKTRRFAFPPRVYINNIGADRIVRCVRVMMSTH